MRDNDFKNIMNDLRSIPIVEKHLKRETTYLSREIVRKRIEINLTRDELSNLTKLMGDTISTDIIVEIESENEKIPVQYHEKLIYCLNNFRTFNEMSITH